LVLQHTSPTGRATARLPNTLTGNPNGLAPAAVTIRTAAAFAAGVQSAASASLVVVQPPEAPPASSPTILPAVPVSIVEQPPEALGSVRAPARLPPADISTLLMRGDDCLRITDIVSARLFYERAADVGAAGAALRLGETFDPVFLDRAQLRGITGDIEKAVFWYRRARDLGSTDARILLEQLDAE
jgi:hypothetical protein